MKTSELTGAALDWVVAKIENPEWFEEGYMDGDPEAALYMDDDAVYSPSTEWEQGGPILEREWIKIEPWPNESDENSRWVATQFDATSVIVCCGPTPLVSAMRCYVASKLGDDVDIPKELLK